MHRASLFFAAFASLAVAGCQGPLDSGYPPLPGPSPDAEAVAVSAEIATPERPVFYYRDPQNGKRLLAYDWTGRLRGSLTVTASEPFGAYPSADGTMLLLTHGHIATGGRVLGRLPSGTWAGDNVHVCAFLNQLGGPGSTRMRQVSANEFEGLDTPGALFYESVNGKSRKVLDYGLFGSHGGPAVLACNAASDRAVIGGSFVADMSGVTMVRLSDGKVITRTLGGSHRGADGTLVSADATLVAQGSTGGVSMGAAADDFSVYRIPGNEFVVQVHGSVAQLFSGDGSRIYVGLENADAVAVIDLHELPESGLDT